MADVTGIDPNEMLKQAEEIATSQAAGAGGSGEVMFGMTLWGLAVASFLGLLGVAYLMYAKRQGRLIIGLCGVALIMFPFFVTDTIAMSIVGAVVVFLPAALKRVGIDI